ncbi:MAG TPA: hypothetical protein EYG03_04980 [Planctomycetes bacterium]|nr:hypothetical protein [Planctomycetota bacterium]
MLEALERMPRNARFFQVAVAVFKETGDSEKLDVAEQNLHQLEDLQKQLFDALTVVGDNIDDVDGRFRVAELLAKLGRFPKAQQWFLTGGAIDPERGDDAQKQMEEHLRVVLPLVGFADDNPPETPADSNKGEARPEDNVNAETNGTKTEATPEGTSKADESQSGVKLNVAPPESKKKEDGSESP